MNDLIYRDYSARRADLVERIKAKDAYGVKSTRLSNELHALDMANSPWRRFLSRAGSVLVWAFALAYWGLLLLPIGYSLALFFKL